MRIEKMRFGRNGKSPDRTTIIYNKHITNGDIPLEAYEYQVNGMSAIEWNMDRYQVTVNRATGTKYNPNEWSDNPCHIVDLLRKIVYVSIETARVVKAMPPLNELQVRDQQHFAG